MVQTNEATTTKKTEFDKANIKNAIAQGKRLITSWKSKADTSREIHNLVKNEDRKIILHVFRQGASLTEKGSLTYLYNIKRKLEKKT